MALKDDEMREAALYEAAAWRIQLTEHRLETSPAFEAWLAVERNAEAWVETETLWAALQSLGSHPRIREHRKGALVRTRRRRLFAFVAAGGVAATLFGAVLAMTAYGRLGDWETIATHRAERRVIALDDGSRLVLDADTRLRVRFDPSSREVELLAGQARFDVAHDAARPFRVHAEGQVVTALGTSFAIDRTTSALTVALIKGRVSVAEDPPLWRRPFLGRSKGPTYLAPGQGVSIAGAASGAGPIIPVTLERATAWEGGRLVFDNEPLAGAVERVSRYSAAPISVGDSQAAQVRVSGVFDAGDTQAFIEAVTQYFDLEAVESERGALVLQTPRKK